MGRKNPCPGTCGPNVTLPLISILQQVRSDFKGWDFLKRKWKCAILDEVPFALDSWDIIGLDPATREYTTTLYCPSGDCFETVQVAGQCHYSAAVNYVLFGLATSLCGDPWWSVSMRIQAWKRLGHLHLFKGPSRSTMDWARAGFDGWAVWSLTPVSPENLNHCQECPDCSLKIFKYKWDGWRWIKPRRRRY